MRKVKHRTGRDIDNCAFKDDENLQDVRNQWKINKEKNDGDFIFNTRFKKKQDWLSPVYSGRLVHLLKFILHTPAHWCIIRG